MSELGVLTRTRLCFPLPRSAQKRSRRPRSFTERKTGTKSRTKGFQREPHKWGFWATRPSLFVSGVDGLLVRRCSGLPRAPVRVPSVHPQEAKGSGFVPSLRLSSGSLASDAALSPLTEQSSIA